MSRLENDKHTFVLDGLLEVFEMSLGDFKNICQAMSAVSAKPNPYNAFVANAQLTLGSHAKEHNRIRRCFTGTCALRHLPVAAATR
jgi:hypothetical protein